MRTEGERRAYVEGRHHGGLVERQRIEEELEARGLNPYPAGTTAAAWWEFRDALVDLGLVVARHLRPVIPWRVYARLAAIENERLKRRRR